MHEFGSRSGGLKPNRFEQRVDVRLLSRADRPAERNSFTLAIGRQRRRRFRWIEGKQQDAESVPDRSLNCQRFFQLRDRSKQADGQRVYIGKRTTG